MLYVITKQQENQVLTNILQEYMNESVIQVTYVIIKQQENQVLTNKQ